MVRLVRSRTSWRYSSHCSICIAAHVLPKLEKSCIRFRESKFAQLTSAGVTGPALAKSCGWLSGWCIRQLTRSTESEASGIDVSQLHVG